MSRRALIWLTGCAVLAGGAWLWLRPSPITLGVRGPASVFGYARPLAAEGTAAGKSVLDAVVRFAPEKGRAELQAARESARQSDGRADFAFSPDRKTTLSAAAGAPVDGGLVLPSTAVLQTRGVDKCYLLLRFEPASGLLEAPARRRWMGTVLAEALREAKTATVAVGEEGPPARTVATIALDFGDGAKAEAALRRLVAQDASGSPVAFTASPGAAETSRVSGLVVVRLEADVRLVNAALGR